MIKKGDNLIILATAEQDEKSDTVYTKLISSHQTGMVFDVENCINAGATNGDMIKAMFPKCKEVGISGIGNIKSIAVDIGLGTSYFSFDWWNVPYKKEVEE